MTLPLHDREDTSLNPLRRIGILGGMGPQATILLQQRIIDATDAHDDASHIPLIVDMNPQVPSRLDWLLNNCGDDPGLTLAIMAQGLEATGAEALAMPCNTAHHFASAITDAVQIPLLNMLELATEQVATLCEPDGAVGILASPATREIQLFEKALEPHQLSTIWPNSSINLLESIVEIKATGVSPLAGRTLQQAAEDCVDQGASCLLIGCTEFSLLSKELRVDCPVIDSLDLLVRRISEFSSSHA